MATHTIHPKQYHIAIGPLKRGAASIAPLHRPNEPTAPYGLIDGNELHIKDQAWVTFCREVGLTAAMLAPGRGAVSGSGLRRVTPDLLAEVNYALARWTSAHAADEAYGVVLKWWQFWLQTITVEFGEKRVAVSLQYTHRG